MRIGIVVVHVGRRLGPLVQLLTVKSFDLPEIKIIGATMSSHKAHCSEGNTRFLTRAGARGLGITTREVAEGTRAHFFAGQIILLLF